MSADTHYNMSDFYVRINYCWYDDGEEKDLTRIARDIGAKIIRQTPMRGLGAIKTWMKILHLKAKQEHIDILIDHLSECGEDMIVRPWNPKVHLSPLNLGELEAAYGKDA